MASPAYLPQFDHVLFVLCPLFLFALVLFDHDGFSTITQTKRLYGTKSVNKTTRCLFNFDGKPYSVEVLDLADNQKELEGIDTNLSRSHRAQAIEREQTRRSETRCRKKYGGFLDVWPDDMNEVLGEDASLESIPSNPEVTCSNRGRKKSQVETTQEKKRKRDENTKQPCENEPVSKKTAKTPAPPRRNLSTSQEDTPSTRTIEGNGRAVRVLFEGGGDYTAQSHPQRPAQYFEGLSPDDVDIVNAQVSNFNSNRRSMGCQTDSVIILSDTEDLAMLSNQNEMGNKAWRTGVDKKLKSIEECLTQMSKHFQMVLPAFLPRQSTMAKETHNVQDGYDTSPIARATTQGSTETERNSPTARATAQWSTETERNSPTARATTQGSTETERNSPIARATARGSKETEGNSPTARATAQERTERNSPTAKATTQGNTETERNSPTARATTQGSTETERNSPTARATALGSKETEGNSPTARATAQGSTETERNSPTAKATTQGNTETERNSPTARATTQGSTETERNSPTARATARGSTETEGNSPTARATAQGSTETERNSPTARATKQGSTETERNSPTARATAQGSTETERNSPTARATTQGSTETERNSPTARATARGSTETEGNSPTARATAQGSTETERNSPTARATTQGSTETERSSPTARATTHDDKSPRTRFAHENLEKRSDRAEDDICAEGEVEECAKAALPDIDEVDIEDAIQRLAEEVGDNSPLQTINIDDFHLITDSPTSSLTAQTNERSVTDQVDRPNNTVASQDRNSASSQRRLQFSDPHARTFHSHNLMTLAGESIHLHCPSNYTTLDISNPADCKPGPFEFRIRQDILHQHSASNSSQGNFLWGLTQEIFKQDELIGRNFTGRKGRQILSPRRKHALIHAYVDFYGRNKAAFLKATSAINSGIRYITLKAKAENNSESM